MTELCRPALSQPVHVNDRAQVVELLELPDVGGLPDRSFRGLAVAEQDVRAIVRADPARVERDADGRADALPERSCRNVDKRQPRRRMAFEIRVDPPQLQQLLARKQAGFRPRGIEHGGRMTFGKNESIVIGVLRILRIEPHLAEEQRGHDVRGRHAARGVPAPCFAR